MECRNSTRDDTRGWLGERNLRTFLSPGREQNYSRKGRRSEVNRKKEYSKLSNYNSVELGKKHYVSDIRYHDSTDGVVDKKQCIQCNKRIVVGHNPRTGKFTSYELDGYPDKLVEHEHPVDNVTRIDLQHRIPIEMRHYRPNKDDYRHLTEKRWMMNYK